MARSLPALGLAAVLTVVLAGCAGGAQADAEPSSSAPAPSSPSSPSPSSSSEPTSAPSVEPAGIDTSDWLEYSTHDGDMTYRYPADWTLESESTFVSPDAGRDDVQDPYERWMDSATLAAPNGQQLLHSTDFADIGGSCEPGTMTRKDVLAVEPSQAQPVTDGDDSVIATLVVEHGDRLVFGMGITSSVHLAEESCHTYFVSSSSDGGVSIGTHFATDIPDPLWAIDSLVDARAYMETDEYATLREILRSVRTS